MYPESFRNAPREAGPKSWKDTSRVLPSTFSLRLDVPPPALCVTLRLPYHTF